MNAAARVVSGTKKYDLGLTHLLHSELFRTFSPFSHGTRTLRCLQKEMATYRHWSVSLWWDPDDVSHCRTLSPDKTEWRLISATLCRWRRCFMADQLWLMTRIREEDSLAQCGRSSHMQAWGDGVQVLAWPGTGLSVWAVHTGRSSCWTTASSFCQPPSTHCSTVSAWYVWPSHLRCRWTNYMELVPKQFAWAGHANWLFLSYTEDVSFWVLGTLSELEALLRRWAI